MREFSEIGIDVSLFVSEIGLGTFSYNVSSDDDLGGSGDEIDVLVDVEDGAVMETAEEMLCDNRATLIPFLLTLLSLSKESDVVALAIVDGPGDGRDGAADGHEHQADHEAYVPLGIFITLRHNEPQRR